MNRDTSQITLLQAANAPRTLSVGVLGAGVIAQQLHIPVLANMPQLTVAWIADVNEARAKALAEANDMRGIGVTDPSALPPADVVLVAVPPGVRKGYFTEFAKRGTALFVEKPFALSLAEHVEYTAAFP